MSKPFQGFEVLYDHAGIVVVNKAFSVPSQPTQGEARTPIPDVFTQLNAHYAYVGQHHRLDQTASGLLLFSTDPSLNKALSDDFQQHKIHRSYWIWVVGNPSATGSWKNSLDGQKAQSDFTVLQSKGGISQLEVILHTGRTHQIRRHAQLNRFPIVGDHKYGGAAKKLWSRLALHAFRLEFTHPSTQEHLRLEAPIPSDLEGILR